MSRQPSRVLPRQTDSGPNVQDLLAQSQEARNQRVQIVQQMQQQIEQIQQQINAESLEVLRLDGEIRAYTALTAEPSFIGQDVVENSHQQDEAIPAE